MSNTAPPWFQDAISALSISRNQRVWSIIVSLFGDMARNSGDQISGPLMSRIIEPIGIRPEAIRVALHRLRNDGWITSQKRGRTSFYALAPRGLDETASATPRIYARTTDTPSCWHVIILRAMSSPERGSAEKPLQGMGYTPLGQGVFLGKGKAPSKPGDAFVLSGQPDHIPDWLKQQIADPWTASYQAMAQSLSTVDQLLNGHTISDLQSATLRTLIVHNWRRILLNHPDLPAEFYPNDWKGFECRDRVMGLLDRLQIADLQKLNRDT